MFYVGDKVKVVDNIDGCGTPLHPIGTIGEVTVVDKGDVLVSAGNFSFYYTEDMLELHKRPLYDEGYVQGLADAEKAIATLLKMSKEEIARFFDAEVLETFTAGDVISAFTIPYIVEQTKKYDKSLPVMERDE